MEVDSERAVVAAVLGALIPELQYSTPLLLERYERGEPLLRRTSPSDPGFEGGAVDPILLEFFKAIVPHVRELLGWGTLGVLPVWYWSVRRNHAEVMAALQTKQQTIDIIADVLTRMDGARVSGKDVVEAIARAIEGRA